MPTTDTYTVQFVRIGRTHDVPNLTVAAADADELATKIHAHARPFLRSEDYMVVVDLEAGRGSIELGRFGVFHDPGSAVTAPAVTPGLLFLNAHGLTITHAVTIAGPCENCDQHPAVLRVYGQPHPDTDHPVECEQLCTDCGPWRVSLALRQQDPRAAGPIQIEIQGA